MAITHTFVSAVADGGDTNLVRPTDWNADHDVPSIEIATGTITASTPAIDITQTWNSAGITFTGFRLNVTTTAHAADSLFVDIQDGGSTVFSVRHDGRVTTAESYLLPAGGTVTWSARGGVALPADGQFQIFSNGFAANSILAIPASHIIEQRNSTNAQTFRWYRTFTDTSNYERGALQTSAGQIILAAETAGTGTDDIDVTLTPAGAGLVRYGTHSAIGSESVTGFITIKDSAGNSRKIAVVS